MQRSSISFLLFTLGSLTIKCTALTLPTLTSFTQLNLTTTPSHDLGPATIKHQTNITEFLSPFCELIPYSTPGPTINRGTCAILAKLLCNHLVTHGSAFRNEWTWTSASGCHLGYYLPNEAILPSQWSCEELSFGSIIRTCAKPGERDLAKRFNAGTINVDEMPGEESAGTAIDDEQGRYLMVPRPLDPVTGEHVA